MMHGDFSLVIDLFFIIGVNASAMCLECSGQKISTELDVLGVRSSGELFETSP